MLWCLLAGFGIKGAGCIGGIAEYPFFAATLTDTLTLRAVGPVDNPIMGAGNLVAIHMHSRRRQVALV